MRMEDKICVVTGGARGIGEGIVRKFAQEGAKMVFACDMNINEELNKVENIRSVKLDVTDRDAIKEFVDKVVEEFEKIDVLVNNAGITKDALIQRMSEEAWDAVINVNLKGVFNMTQFIAPIMIKKGKGSIISTSSIVGVFGNIGQTNYAATKGGVISMTKTWAKEFSRKGAQVRSNAIAPGFIKTPMTEAMPEKILNSIAEKVPLKRMGEVEDIANAALFLASDESSYVNGQILGVDGGLVI
ncbi:beta-ketoacyl-ACP reductase [Tepiditoga spiralis]|uniref:Beta-ketoacyl-ACP reductase n=1 Tax=Tepiditoga spiralis TaxID=2108365 RepID=A0A7G1GAD8_9BACT|nr:beta-ketoacyl-ACP reductase [Tepiditoga spiralis]BBE30419.1 beta-ketoacyl-ACP reductase [Tepiditoga spiralis]